MATIELCDKCYREINLTAGAEGSGIRVTLYRQGKIIDLCEVCAHDFMVWLENIDLRED